MCPVTVTHHFEQVQQTYITQTHVQTLFMPSSEQESWATQRVAPDHPPDVGHEPPCGHDARLLPLLGRLVVMAQGLCLAASTEHRPGVARVGHVQGSPCQQGHYSRTACLQGVLRQAVGGGRPLCAGLRRCVLAEMSTLLGLAHRVMI